MGKGGLLLRRALSLASKAGKRSVWIDKQWFQQHAVAVKRIALDAIETLTVYTDNGLILTVTKWSRDNIDVDIAHSGGGGA